MAMVEEVAHEPCRMAHVTLDASHARVRRRRLRGRRPSAADDRVHLLLQRLHQQGGRTGAHLAGGDGLREHRQGLRDGDRRVARAATRSHAHQAAQPRHQQREGRGCTGE